MALVTGGDSGIGHSVAVLFARAGADVALNYLDEDEDAQETKSCVEAEGRRGLTLAGDVGEPAFCRHAVQRTVDELGGLQILVNNAAVQLHAPAITDLDDARWDMTLRTNIGGYFHMARAAVPQLKAGSAIINTWVCRAAPNCRTTRPPRVRSTPSPSRWPDSCWTRASA